MVVVSLLRGAVATAVLLTTPRLVDAVAPAERGDANIGAGLLAFAAVVVLSGAWSLRDGYRHGFGWTLRTWALAAILPAVGLWLGLAITEADAGTSVTDLLRADVALVPMLYAFVITGAVVGAGLGEAVRPLPRS